MRRIVLVTLMTAFALLVTGLVFASRQPHQQGVAFRNGDVTLAGTLYTPRSTGPHPAVIFIHGSGDDSRENYRLYADLLAKNGIAALVYDKRGVGASTGSWKQSPFSALADDALAGIQFLRNHRSVDPQRVGAWGGSEGGVIAPWIASRSPDVAFVIMQAATGVTFAEQNLYQNEQRIRAHTTSEDEIAQGLQIVKLQAHYARTGEGWRSYADAKEAARVYPWSSALGPVISADSWWWTWYRTKLDFDPIPIMERVRVPVLSVWGERDRLVPVAKSRTAIEDALRRGGNQDVTCSVYAGADHSIQVNSALHGFGPDPRYLNDLTTWVRKRTGLSR